MKRLINLCILVAIPVLLLSQTTSTTAVFNYNGLEKNMEKSNEDIENPKKNDDPKTYLKRAELFIEIFNLHRQHIRKGMTTTEVMFMFGNPNEKLQETKGNDITEIYVFDGFKLFLKGGVVDDWEELKIIHEDPLPVALEALQKAEELDVDGKLDKKTSKTLLELKTALEIRAVESYSDGNIDKSYKSFLDIIKVTESDLYEGVDTVILYNAGMLGLNVEIEDYETALKNLQEAEKYSYDEPNMYVMLKKANYAVGDTLAGIEALKRGFERYPDNQVILIELINYYLLSGQSDEALDYISKAKEQDPNNVSFLFAEGSLYDKMGNQEKAITAYKQAIEADPTYFNAYYNLSVLYYNRAVNILDKAARIADIKEYNAEVEKANVELRNSLPYMEKAAEINPEDRSALETLKTLYYRLKMDNKYNEIKEILENM